MQMIWPLQLLIHAKGAKVAWVAKVTWAAKVAWVAKATWAALVVNWPHIKRGGSNTLLSPFII